MLDHIRDPIQWAWRAVADVENFPSQPCGGHSRHGPPGRADGRLQAAVRFGHFQAPAPAADFTHGDDQSNGGVDCPTDYRRLPLEQAPGYLIRDRDGAYGHAVTKRLGAMGIRDHPTAVRSPWQNRHAERLIGSIRRECLDHIVVFGEGHLRGILAAYAAYYNGLRTHLSLDKDSPSHRPTQRFGRVTARPILGRLHHQYCRI